MVGSISSQIIRLAVLIDSHVLVAQYRPNTPPSGSLLFYPLVLQKLHVIYGEKVNDF